jgi:hypothetical protein
MAGLELRIVARRFQEKRLAGYWLRALIVKWWLGAVVLIKKSGAGNRMHCNPFLVS